MKCCCYGIVPPSTAGVPVSYTPPEAEGESLDVVSARGKTIHSHLYRHTGVAGFAPRFGVPRQTTIWCFSEKQVGNTGWCPPHKTYYVNPGSASRFSFSILFYFSLDKENEGMAYYYLVSFRSELKSLTCWS